MVILKPTHDAMESAASALRDGRVVAMPTETVYGLACSALNPEAVSRVFEIKGRPSDNPLIVHLASFADLRLVASSWPAAAEKLAARFWPGPLTMVLPKKERVPKETTGGLDTVAVRVPRHPVALDLIRMAGIPLAAPSANPFMGLSPTRAEDIDPAILVDVEMVLDGGPCEVGLESTVIDLSGEFPRILRPGGASRSDIQAVLGMPLGELPPPSVRKSPGMYPRHYAPKAVVQVAKAVPDNAAGLVFRAPANDLQIRMPKEAIAYGAMLYTALRRLDSQGVEAIAVEEPPQGLEWEAVRDRLDKASHPEKRV